MTQAPINDPHDEEQLITTELAISGEVSEGEQRHAVDAVSHALHDVDLPVLHCRIFLEHKTDPHHVRRAKAKLSVVLNGTPVHAHADAETMNGAADLAADRLHEQLRKQVDRRQHARRHGESISGRH
ncbi:MAG: HPF/RaiA family ribosome-associated protein [Ilumatobacter sp.]|jgi:ribosome-associated translation inhibitor RaiA|uniref:HPF/RaiA family ribosome-associated protein n=1 Tax=Ilumatobacter sp. TaxID=1967498 RepID=UPI00391D3B63